MIRPCSLGGFRLKQIIFKCSLISCHGLNQSVSHYVSFYQRTTEYTHTCTFFNPELSPDVGGRGL